MLSKYEKLGNLTYLEIKYFIPYLEINVKWQEYYSTIYGPMQYHDIRKNISSLECDYKICQNERNVFSSIETVIT